MRSTRRAREAAALQLSLWEGEGEPGEPRRPPASARPGAATEGTAPCVVVERDDFLSRGWPAGTVLHHRPATRADRGTLTVVRDGGRTLVGFFGLDVGRPALFTDRGSTWLGEGAKVVGVVTAVEPPAF